MQIKKNKIVFGAILGVVVLFIVSYSILMLGDDEAETDNLKQTLVPELQQEQEDYTSKLEAIDDLKEVRETNAPSIYDEKYLDSLGFYDQDNLIKEKQRIVDSIYSSGKIDYTAMTYRNQSTAQPKVVESKPIDTIIAPIEKEIAAKELGLEHQLFFASDPQKNPEILNTKTDATIQVVVDGNQTVKADFRLRMRLAKDALINSKIVPKNTPVFGFLSFQPNRAMIEITNIMHEPVSLKAFDLQDGSEGIYVENSFRADAKREVVEDIVNDINISGVPQVTGVKQLFQRSNRNVKVTIVNNYKLILKPQL
ncbi:conjugative transposon protein TraM [uncultured Aquimarina sp.]|uniref:conjugative transposon protein TraM n=1 Tax=uncultured Aquimarina sp. TaxID=575652 RepID=UPI002634DF54|nr:conjugative transposon protein TraM [uncultured Aquimarina sp.]